MLYRLTYIRLGSPRSMTFFAADLADTARFSELWERVTKCPVLTLKPDGRSSFAARDFYTRKHHKASHSLEA